jgi:uncharacterized protein YndB with AHSA1/START domain
LSSAEVRFHRINRIKSGINRSKSIGGRSEAGVASITVTTEMVSPPGRLWPLIVDFSRHGEWLVGHDRFVTEPPAEPVVGATFVQRGTLKGVSGAVTWTIERLEADRLLELSGTGPMGIRLAARFELSPDGSGAQVVCRYDVEGPPMIGLLVRAGKGTAHRYTTASADRLDALARSGRRRLRQIA